MKRIALGLVMAASVAACSGAGGGSGPADVAEQFIRKFDTGNCDGMQDLLAASSRAAAGAELEKGCRAVAEMRKSAPDLMKSAQLKDLRVLETKEEGDRAIVRLEAEMADGRKDSGAPLVLVREDGNWRLDLQATEANARASGMMPGGPGGGAPAGPPEAPKQPAAPAQPPANGQ
jgi:hypothetical protein